MNSKFIRILKQFKYKIKNEFSSSYDTSFKLNSLKKKFPIEEHLRHSCIACVDKILDSYKEKERCERKSSFIGSPNIKKEYTHWLDILCTEDIRNHGRMIEFIKRNFTLIPSDVFKILVYALLLLAIVEEEKRKKKIHLIQKYQRTADCCGILGYIGNKDASKILIEGIEVLQNRGYDSCGMTTIGKDNVLKTTKYASTSTLDAIEKLKKNYVNTHKNDTIGIAHTRWATHGSKVDENAHPHSDYKERISIVHNGIIENYLELKTFLQKENIPFKSSTDTEVIANLIGYYLDKEEDFENAVLSTIKKLEGTWGVCIIHKDHMNEMILAANGSPLHIGFKNEEIFIASEYSALSMYTNEYISLKNGEILFINKDKIEDLKIMKKVQNIPEINLQKVPDPFPHWTIKEIHEQPLSLAKALNHGGRFSYINNLVKLGGLDAKKETFSNIENLIITGSGTSYYASLYAKYIMNYLNCFNTVQVMEPSDFNLSVIPKEKEGIIFVSQSGETRDVIKACKLSYDLNLKKMSVVNVVGSTIANMTGCGVYLNAGREVGVASTKCFTSQVAVLTLIALWFFQNKKNFTCSNKISSLIDSLHRLPLYAGMTIKSCENACKLLSSKLKDKNSMFILGNGLSYPIALEGALKIKELTYIHCEGFQGTSLKHGPYALLGGKESIPVIMMVFNDSSKHVMINTGEQIKSRGAYIICITDDENLVKNFADDIILIPTNGMLTPLLGVIPLQMLAYYISVQKGNNPDKPRCLAKTVTVS